MQYFSVRRPSVVNLLYLRLRRSCHVLKIYAVYTLLNPQSTSSLAKECSTLLCRQLLRDMTYDVRIVMFPSPRRLPATQHYTQPQCTSWEAHELKIMRAEFSSKPSRPNVQIIDGNSMENGGPILTSGQDRNSFDSQ